jgi:PRTRC genetic system ThiF family protein
MYTYSPHLNLGEGHVVIVGLGGTGAQAARSIARVIYAMKLNAIKTPRLVLIDPDTVEEKNIGRQLFTHGDKGKNKATVVMQRLNAAYGLQCWAVPKPVSAEYLGNARIIVGCVDNHAARQVIHNRLVAYNPYGTQCVWIDAGNHHNSGQVCLGDSAKNTVPVAPDKQNAYKHLPAPGLLLPSLLEPEPPSQDTTHLSCAELMLSGEQDLLINDWMGIIAAQYTKQLLLMEPISTFLTYVAPNYLSMKSVQISPENLASYLPETEK